MKSLLKKDEAVKKSEKIIVKQTNSKSKSKLRKTQKITKEVSVPSANDVESTKIVNDTEPVLKTSSLDFPVTPAGIGNISMDNTDTPNESISNIDGVYDQSIDNLNVLPIPQVEAIRTISAQVIEDMSERLKSQLLHDIKHLVASEIKKIEIRPHNVHTYKRHSKDSESHTEKISPTRQNSSTKMKPGVRQLRRPTSSQHLHFENLDQFLDDVRIYISQELIGGNSKSSHDSGQRVENNDRNRHIRGHQRYQSGVLNHVGHRKHVIHNKENNESNINTTEKVSANASVSHVSYKHYKPTNQYDRVPYPRNIRVGDDMSQHLQPVLSDSDHNVLKHKKHNEKHHAKGKHIRSDQQFKDEEDEQHLTTLYGFKSNFKEIPAKTPTKNYKKTHHKHVINKAEPTQKHPQQKKTQRMEGKHVDFHEPDVSKNALRTQRHSSEECGSKNILNDKSNKIKCVIKTTQTPSKKLVEKDTMTATEDIEEANERLSFNTVPKRVEMPVTTARLRNFKRRGRWSSMLSAALNIDDVDYNDRSKEESEVKRADPLTGITFKKPGIQYAWSTSRMSEEYKQNFVDSIRRKQKIDKNRNRPINKESIYNLKPSLNEPKSKDILLNRCLQSLGVKDLEKNQQCLEKVSDAEININLPFSNRILDMLLTYCQSKAFDTNSLLRFKSIWLELKVDEQCIPIGHPTKIKWFELLISLGPIPKTKKGNGKKGTKSRKASTKTKVVKSSLIRRKSTKTKDRGKRYQDGNKDYQFEAFEHWTNTSTVRETYWQMSFSSCPAYNTSYYKKEKSR